MKKIVSVLCAAAVLLSVSGCGGTAEATTTTATTTAAEQTTPAGNDNEPISTPAQTEEEIEVPEDMEYVIENGITERMKALSTYVEGNCVRLVKALEKAENGEELTVAYLGGSITQGSSAGDDLCYARLTTNWLAEKFPDAKINYVRAGIGATGSYIGVHRAKRDVISKNPDLVFIDFSVNDTTEHTERNINAYDSLIQMLWNSESAPAIVTIAMTMEDGTSFQRYHSEICEAYQIPMISYREAILDVIKNGHIVWTDISDDNIHPNVTGHAVLTELITAYLEKYTEGIRDLGNESDLSTPFTENKFMNADIVTPENTTPIDAAGWQTQSTNFGNFGDHWTVRSTDGSFEGVNPLKFEVEAKNIGVFYGKLTKNGGTFDVVVDGTVAKTINSAFPGGWGSYVEAEEVISFDETGKHTVEIVPHTGEKAVINISAIAVS